jgi:hypothetical protein
MQAKTQQPQTDSINCLFSPHGRLPRNRQSRYPIAHICGKEKQAISGEFAEFHRKSRASAIKERRLTDHLHSANCVVKRRNLGDVGKMMLLYGA